MTNITAVGFSLFSDSGGPRWAPGAINGRLGAKSRSQGMGRDLWGSTLCRSHDVGGLGLGEVSTSS
eukprot:9479680-Pyramimonas_sp.AAC.1